MKQFLDFDELCSKLEKASEQKEKVELTNLLDNYKPFNNFTSKHFTIIQNNICCKNSINILNDMLQKDFGLLQNEINLEKVFNYHSYDLSKVLDILELYSSKKQDINNDILFQLSKIIIKKDKITCEKILNIFESIKNIRNNLPNEIKKQIKLEKEDLLDIDIINHMICILKDSDSVQERYIDKIYINFGNEEKKELLSKLVIYLMNKKIKLPDQLIDKLCSCNSGEKIIEFIPSFLSNKNISDNYKNIFSNKLIEYLYQNKELKKKKKFFDRFVLYCKFSNLTSRLQEYIISNINKISENKTDYGKYLIFSLIIH